MNITREFDYDAYRDSETVRELVDAYLIVNRNIQSNTLDENSDMMETTFAKSFGKHMASEIERVAPKYWEKIKLEQD